MDFSYCFIAPRSMRCYFCALLHIFPPAISSLLPPLSKTRLLSLRGVLATKQSNCLLPRHCFAEFTLSPRFLAALRMTTAEGSLRMTEGEELAMTVG